MADVVKFYPKDAAKNPDLVLEQAIGNYKHVLILGWDNGMELDARGSDLFSDGGNVLWLIETFKHKLLSGDYKGDK